MHAVLFLLHQTLPTITQLAAHKSQLPLVRGDPSMAPHPGSILSATGTAIMHLQAAVHCCASNFTYPQHAPNDPDNLEAALQLFW